MHELLPHFFHRNAFCFMGLRVILVRGQGPIQARASAPAKLLRAESRDIDEKKPVRNKRCWLDGSLVLVCLFDVWRFEFHNKLGYRNLRSLRNQGFGYWAGSDGIRD